MNYRGYTIQPSSHFPGRVEYFNEGSKVLHALNVKDAMEQIAEKEMCESKDWKVETIVSLKDATGKTSGYKLRNITRVTGLSEAVPFAVRYNGELTTTFNCP